MEIERKFLVKQPPAGWQRCPSSRIVQGYFPIAEKNLEIRLRRKGKGHCITIKFGVGGRRLEEELPIPPLVFQSLWPLTGAARVAKRRYRIPFEGYRIEMDVYVGRHRGLKTADVEFDSVRESRAFQKPGWLGREITRDPRFANSRLARQKGKRTKPRH